MSFEFRRLEIPGVVLIETSVSRDGRGTFCETYKRSEFERAGIRDVFVQQNHSRSRACVLRGLHFQKEPKAQAKLVRVVQGEIFDVVVDIRKGSPTYGRWLSKVLSGGRGQMLYVPKGCAHGFCILSEEADVIYQVTAEYAPDLEGGVVWNDPALAIPWPIDNPIVSPKDSLLPVLEHTEADFVHV